MQILANFSGCRVSEPWLRRLATRITVVEDMLIGSVCIRPEMKLGWVESAGWPEAGKAEGDPVALSEVSYLVGPARIPEDEGIAPGTAGELVPGPAAVEPVVTGAPR